MAADRSLVVVLRALGGLGRGAWMWFYRFTFGEDVFISYARLDGQRYALGLQSQLNRTVSVLMDQYVGEPGIETPPQVRKGLKRCRQLVVIATPAALSSKNVDEEIRLFPRRSRAVQVIAFGAPIESARWIDAIPGLSIHTEDPAKIESGPASADIVETIGNSVGYWRQRRRNNLQVAFALVSTVLGLAGAVWVSRLADTIQQQQQELTQGKKELADLTTERDRATDERDGARREAVARADLAGIEARRRQIGYVPPDDLPLALGAARTLEAAKLDPEAVAALSAVVDTMPRLVKQWRIPGGVSTHAALHGDTLMLVSDGGATLESWDYLNGTSGKLRLQHHEPVKSWVVEGDGALLLSVTDRSIYAWRLPGGEPVLESACRGCANPHASPKGRYVAVSRGADIGLFDLQSKRELPSITRHTTGISIPFFATTDDVVLAIVGESNTPRRLEAYHLTGTSIDPATVLPRDCLPPRTARITQQASGRILVSQFGDSISARLRFCSLASGTVADTGPYHDPEVTLNDEGSKILVRDAITGSTGRVTLLDAFNGGQTGSVPERQNQIQSFSGDGRFFASAPYGGSFGPGIKEDPVWVGAAIDGRLRCAVPRTHPWEFIRLSEDGRFVVLGARNGVDLRFRDFETWECEPHARLNGLIHVGALGSLEIGWDGAVSIVYYGFSETPFLLPRTWQARMDRDTVGTRFAIATAEGAPSNLEPKAIRLYTTAPPGAHHEVKARLSQGNLRYTNRGWLMLDSENDSIVLHAIDPPREIKRWRVPSGAGRQYTFLRRARFVSRAVNHLQSVFDLIQNQEFRVPPGITDLAEAKEGYRMASVEPQTSPAAGFLVRVRDLKDSRDLLPPVRTAVEPVISLSDDGHLLLVAAQARLSVWDLDEQRLVAEVPESDDVRHVGFGPANRWIWHDTGQLIRVRLWKIRDLMRLACDLMRRNRISPNWPASAADAACTAPS